MSPVDDDRRHAAAALVQLRLRVDDHFAAAQARSPDHMQCAPGCDGCCQPGLSVFGIEADRIRAALRQLAVDAPDVRARVRAQAGEPGPRCALLVDGRCSVYADRPLLCRSHGLPVRRPDGVVAGCSLNFTRAVPPAASILALTAVDAPLSIMARMWDGGTRIELAALARE